MRVDYQRISEEAYEEREEAVPNRFDRTTLAGALVVFSLAALALFLAVVLANDLSHQTMLQTLQGMLHAVELRVAGL